MLSKLLKYDLSSMLKSFLLIWGAALVLAFVNHFTLGGLHFESSSFMVSSLLKVVPFLMFLAIMVSMAVLTLIFVIQRFYNGLLKDEGYLMFTLPVKPWQLITSKGISAVLVNIISGIIAIVAIMILFPWKDVGEFIREFWNGLFLNAPIPVWQIVVLILEFLFMVLVNVAKSIYQIYAAIALGHQFKKHRVGMAFVMYLLISLALSTIASSILQLIFSSGSITLDTLLDTFSRWNWSFFGSVSFGLWILILIAGVQLVAFHIIAERLLSKRLNLE
ncbi:MAG: hypothetical protein IKE00_01145 [Oscillospiraceae bacterium]|nr:hypothetical protein [Oscillospiraceae bacterium]